MTETTRTEHRSEEVTIRMLSAEERPALELLAERDSSQAPAGTVIGGFAGGELIAAASLNGGATVADPFSRTAEVRSLLRRRVAQLRGTGSRGGGLFTMPPRLGRLTARG